jgi:nicotinate-nucleotide adenylyltransferase
VLEQAGLLLAARPGSAVMTAEQLRQRLHLPEETPLSLEVIETPQVDISSRNLRRRAAASRSLRYFLPRAVECYIRDKALYKSSI